MHTELIQYRRARLIKQGIINEELHVDSRTRKGNGSCPLMPEEVLWDNVFHSNISLQMVAHAGLISSAFFLVHIYVCMYVLQVFSVSGAGPFLFWG